MNSSLSKQRKKWYNVKIFISSTFKDMDRERDILRLVVEPQLNSFFKQWHIHVMFVDLRKDVETDKALPVEEREKQIFKVCMKEIEECSPFFIGLVGDRYGWIPPHHVLMTTPELYNSGAALIGAPIEKSVTFYEFAKGIFVNGGVSSTALVYIRKTEKDVDNNLLAFKSYLKRIFSKTQKHGNSNGLLKEYSISDLSDANGGWAQAVFTDIKHTIMSSFHISGNESFNLADLIDAEQQKFVYEKTKQFWGRSKELEHIESNINNSMGCFIVKKEPGIGASSLMCMAYQNFLEKGYTCLFHSIQASDNSSHAEELLYRWCWQLEREVDCSDINHLKMAVDDIEALSDYLNILITRIYEKGLKVIVFVDGMPIDSIPFFQRIHNKIILIQVIENKDIINKEAYDLLSKSNAIILLDEIESTTKDKLIAGQRKVVRSVLTTRKESGNPRWLSMACFITSRLTKQDFNSIRSREEKDNENRIDAYLESFVKQIPMEIENVSLFWIEKLCEIYGKSYVEKYIGLFSYSREGWLDEDVAKLTGENLSKCLSFRQSCGNLIFEQSESGFKRMKSELAELWKVRHNLDSNFFQQIKKYLYKLPIENITRRMNLFRFARLCHDMDICKDVILHETHLDPYDTPSLKDFLYLFYENQEEGNALVMDILEKIDDMYELDTFYHWCTFLRAIGLTDIFISVHKIISVRMTQITDSDLTSFDQYWNEKYNVLLDFVDHYVEINQTDKVVNVAERCQKNLLMAILHNEEKQEEMQTSFFHWCCLYMECIPKLQEKLIFGNSIVNLVKSQKIALCNMSRINYCVFVMNVAENLGEAGDYESGIDLLLYELKIYVDLLTNFNSNDIIRNESYDNYCIGVRNLCYFAAQSNISLKQYKVQIKTALQYAEKAMGTWTVNPISYYEVLLYYLQVNMDDVENMQLLNNALDKLGNDIAGKNVHELLPTLLMLCAYKEFFCTKTRNLKDYYKTHEVYEGYNRLYRVIIQTHETEYEAAQIYHQYSSVLEGLQTNNHEKQLIEGVSCLEKCRKAIKEGKYQFSQIEQNISEILNKLHLKHNSSYSAWERHRNLLNVLKEYAKESTKDTGYDDDNNSSDLGTENWLIEQESIISNAINNGEISVAESKSEMLLKHVLDSSKYDFELLGKAYYLSGVVQLEKKIWFKAYDRLEKSLKNYECDGDSVAPIIVYEKLAEAYIKSQNIMEAETLLNEAIRKISAKKTSGEEIISLQKLLNTIKPKEKATSDNGEKVLPLKNNEVHTKSVWNRILSLFRR